MSHPPGHGGGRTGGDFSGIFFGDFCSGSWECRQSQPGRGATLGAKSHRATSRHREGTAVSPRGPARPVLSPRVAWEPCPAPAPVCVPTHHAPLGDPGRAGGGIIFLSVVVVVVLTKPKYLRRPAGSGCGSLGWNARLGARQERGDTRPRGEGPARRLHPWRAPQCLYIDMFVRGSGPFLAPKQLQESQKVTKIFHCPRKGGSEE